MVANINESPIRVLSKIPRNYGTTFMYDTLDTARHYEDGWRDVISEELGPDQKAGEVFYDPGLDSFVRPAVDMTPQEVEDYNAQQAQFEEEQRKQTRRQLSDQGITVQVQGHNVTMSKSELNDFIAMKKVLEDAGQTEISWETDTLDTWVTMTMAEATGVAAQLAQGFLAIYQNN